VRRNHPTGSDLAKPSTPPCMGHAKTTSDRQALQTPPVGMRGMQWLRAAEIIDEQSRPTPSAQPGNGSAAIVAAWLD